MTPVVKNLVIINVLVFLAQSAMPKLEPLLMGHYPLSANFEPWQVITHMFMHGSLTHIFFNMFALVVFGSALERAWGSKRFLQYYMLCGIGAFFIYEATVGYEVFQLTDSISFEGLAGRVVGASGCVYGLLLGFGMLFPNTELILLFPPIPIKAKYFVIIYGLIELSLAMSNSPGDNVAHVAHLGGMLFGFLLIKQWQNNRKNFY
ncbi:MAG: rhomboid family intramembrane serine protease [Bacteroidota bacterium]|nr:rhomboid family intramembrane serine protease [Bacteroidota bacterium]